MGGNNHNEQFNTRDAVEENAFNSFMGNNHDTGSSAVSEQRKELGVLQKIATVQKNDNDYRQLLLMGAFPDDVMAKKCVAAINERKMCGVDITPILDRVVAECAVRSGGRWYGGRSQMSRVQEIITALTHFEFNAGNQRQAPKERKDADTSVG